MQSIKRNKDTNLAGSVQLYFIPLSSVDVANFPERDPGTLDISQTIPLLGSAKWLMIQSVRESVDSSDNGKVTGDGSLYDHTTGGFFASDNVGATVQFDKMKAEGRYLVLRKDANGFFTLKGTPKEPLTFTYSKLSRDRITGLKGYEFKFSGSCSKPELYFTASFETDESTVSNRPTTATAKLYDEEGGNLLSTTVIPLGTEEGIIAPPASVTLFGEDFIEAKSGSSYDIEIKDQDGDDVAISSTAAQQININIDKSAYLSVLFPEGVEMIEVPISDGVNNFDITSFTADSDTILFTQDDEEPTTDLDAYLEANEFLSLSEGFIRIKRSSFAADELVTLIGTNG
jgi:hypothetical protein